MTIYRILTAPASERAKADADRNYYPREVVCGHLYCEEHEIDDKLRKAIKAGEFPADAYATDSHLEELHLVEAA